MGDEEKVMHLGLPKTIFAVPKSASTNFARTLSMVSNLKQKRPKYRIGNENKPIVTNDLRKDYFSEMSSRHLCSMHTIPNGLNLWYIDNVDMKYIILVRNPMDQLTAMYCHQLKSKNREKGKYDYISPIPKFSGKDVDEDLELFINSDYIIDVLRWINNWEMFRSNNSILLKYEYYCNCPVEMIRRAKMFFTNEDLTGENKERIKSEIKKVGHGKSKKSINKDFYPRGYTMGEGVWKKYFNKRNKELYKQRVKTASYDLSEIKKIYPEVFQ